MGLVETPPGEIAGGEIIFEGEDLLKKNEKEMSKIRGKKIAMIFQELLIVKPCIYYRTAAYEKSDAS